MKAIVYERYGAPDVLEFRETAKPSPKDGEVLVKVHAASVNAADWHMLRAEPFVARLIGGLLKPKFQILGSDIAGRVEAVGSGVKGFRAGDEVFGDLFSNGFGGFAEYACARESHLLPKPANLTFAEAAAVPLAGETALQGLRGKAPARPGRKVLIHGAGGGVGTFAVQIAKAMGDDVTAVCGAGNVELVRSLGADRVLDYAKEDFAAGGRRYDLIVAVNGDRPIAEYKRALEPGGSCVVIGGTNRQIFQGLLLGPLLSIGGDRTLRGLEVKTNGKDLGILKEYIESGKVKPVIDRRFGLREVPDAIRYLEAGHARGKIVIDIAN